MSADFVYKTNRYDVNYIKEHSYNIFKNYSFVEQVYLFGSYARGTASEKSDLDFFVKISEPVGLSFFGLYDELHEEFNITVDVLTEAEVNELLCANPKSSIRKDAILIYERQDKNIL